MPISDLSRSRSGSIAAVGVLSILALAGAIASFCSPYVNIRALLLVAGVGIALQVFLWRLTLHFQDYGKALLTTMLGIAALTYLPFGAPIVFGLAGAALFSGPWKSIAGRIRSDRFHAVSVLGFGIFYALPVFQSMSGNLVHGFVEEQTRQLTLDPDNLFFMAMSSMFRYLGVMATGLNGLHWVPYHTLAFGLYGRLSEMLGIGVVETYGYGNFVVLGPLLCTSLLNVADSFAFSSTGGRRAKWFGMNLVVYGAALSETFGLQPQSHFVSESYLLGLILLSGALCTLSETYRSTKVSTGDVIALAFFALSTTLAKISVGFILTGFTGIFLLFATKISSLRKLAAGATVGVFGLAGFLLARPYPVPGLESKFVWNFYFLNRHAPSLPLFYIEYLPYFLLTAVLFAGLLYRGKWREHFPWIVAAIWGGIVGYLGLNFTFDTSCYYFSNVHVFMTVPLLVSVLSTIDWTNAKAEFTKASAVPAALIIVALLATSYYSVRTLAVRDLRKIATNRRELIAHSGKDFAYSALLDVAAKDPDRKTMVYIPKSEAEFWSNAFDEYSPWRDQQCLKTAFLIPILSHKPAVLGLPDDRTCHTFVRGFETYSKAEFEKSRAPNLSDAEVCAEVNAAGFESFYRITKLSGASKVYCSK